MNERILLAECNPILRYDVSRYLAGNHFAVEEVSSAHDAMASISRHAPDLVILDTELSHREGRDVCAEIRTSSAVPIILTSSESSVAERIRGLESGADDFLQTPCDMRELGARAKAVLRRSRLKDRTSSALVYDNFALSIEKYELRLRGERVELTPKELQLLHFLASNPNKVFTRDQLLDRVWGYQYLGNTRTIDAHIRKVREKCDGVSDKWAIRTIWGVGYKFETA